MRLDHDPTHRKTAPIVNLHDVMFVGVEEEVLSPRHFGDVKSCRLLALQRPREDVRFLAAVGVVRTGRQLQNEIHGLDT